MNNKKILVTGAGGFIGNHLVKRLKAEGDWVRGVDLKYPEFSKTAADDFIVGDLRDPLVCKKSFDQAFDEVYQLAADMGGAGFVFTGENDADIMHNSALINLNMLELSNKNKVKKIFILLQPAYTPNIISATQIIRIVPKTAHILLIRTANMAGKNYSASACIYLLTEIIKCR